MYTFLLKTLFAVKMTDVFEYIFGGDKFVIQHLTSLLQTNRERYFSCEHFLCSNDEEVS